MMLREEGRGARRGRQGEGGGVVEDVPVTFRNLGRRYFFLRLRTQASSVPETCMTV